MTNQNAILDEYLINHCAPTLAGIKCSNLFGITYTSPTKLCLEVARLHTAGKAKGLSARVLSSKNGRALIYVYRETLLKKSLADPRARKLLTGYGYPTDNLEALLDTLGRRIARVDGFPHEIGLFLGYPYEDVKGFIDHTGQDFIFSGYWKVYENPEAAHCLFASYDQCKNCMRRSYQCGKSIMQLMVAV